MKKIKTKKSKNLKLYHYSNKKLDVISPDFLGYNSYTSNEIKSSQVKRAFYFVDLKDIKRPPEYRFINNEYIHVYEIQARRVYNLVIDRLKLIDKAKLKNLDIIDYNKLFNLIQQAGYIGTLYNIGYNVTVLFENIRPQTVYKRINGLYIKEGKKT
jgi:hypothetical protein